VHTRLAKPAKCAFIVHQNSELGIVKGEVLSFLCFFEILPYNLQERRNVKVTTIDEPIVKTSIGEEGLMLDEKIQRNC
jgi:hypothetical protein